MLLSIGVNDTTSEQKQVFPEYGYLAQELENVFPDLVSKGSDGYYSINYFGLIPIIVEALKDQKEENTQQQKEIKALQDIVFSQEKDLNEMRNMINVIMNCCENTGIMQDTSVSGNNNHKSNNNNNNTQTQTTEETILYQNIPNPFSSNTEISCEIPASFNSAFIYVYNLQGVELMSFPITQTGHSTITVYGSVLPALHLGSGQCNY